MSGTDKIKNKAQKAQGKAKETKGRVTRDANAADKGRAKQVKSDLKTAGENVKDSFKH